MANQPNKPTVELEGRDLTTARQILAESEKGHHELAHMVLNRVHGESRKAGDRLSTAIRFNNTVAVYYDGQNCAAYEDPPGICRDCTAGERTMAEENHGQ